MLQFSFKTSQSESQMAMMKSIWALSCRCFTPLDRLHPYVPLHSSHKRLASLYLTRACKNKIDITPFLITSRVIFFFTVLITDAVQCGIFNAISKKHFRYSRFVKRRIAIEAQLYFVGLVGPIGHKKQKKFLF